MLLYLFSRLLPSDDCYNTPDNGSWIQGLWRTCVLAMQDKDALQCYIGNVIRVCTVIYFFIIIFFTNILLNSYKCEADNRCSNLRQSLSARSTKIPIYTRGGAS